MENAAIWWGLGGLALIASDMLFGTFFLLFCGIGALITSLAIYLGLSHSWLNEFLLFSISSLLLVVLFRKSLVKKFGPQSGQTFEEHLGKTVKVTSRISSHGKGRAVYRGAEWDAMSASGREYEENSEATIQKLEGITLVLE